MAKCNDELVLLPCTMFAAGYHDSLVCNPLAGKVGNLSQLQYLDGNAVSLLSPSEDIFYHPSLSEDILLRPHSNTNKTISDGGITVDFWIIKVHTSN